MRMAAEEVLEGIKGGYVKAMFNRPKRKWTFKYDPLKGFPCEVTDAVFRLRDAGKIRINHPNHSTCTIEVV